MDGISQDHGSGVDTLLCRPRLGSGRKNDGRAPPERAPKSLTSARPS
jgi:hypothetical protein